MNRLQQFFKKFWRDERGLEVVEWVLIGAIVVTLVALIAGNLEGGVANTVNNLVNALG
jgi:Flp pilus assembly pilin Flp